METADFHTQHGRIRSGFEPVAPQVPPRPFRLASRPLMCSAPLQCSAALIRLSGWFGGAAADALTQHVHAQLQAGARGLVLDLRRATGITAPAVATCVLMAAECEEAGGGLILLPIPGAVRDIFEVLGLDQAIHVTHDLAEAVGILRTAGWPPARG